MTNYAERIAKGSIIFFIMTILSAFVGYLLRTYLARNLSIADYGIFYTVFIFVAFIMTFRDLGINPASVKFIPEFIVKKRPDKIKSLLIFSMGFQIIFSSLIAFILFLMTDYLSIYFFKNPLATEIIPILLLFFVVNTFFCIFRFTFHGFQKLDLMSFADFLNIFSAAICIAVLFFFLGPSSVNASYGYVIGTLITSVICLILLLKIFPSFTTAKLEFDWGFTKKFMAFSFATIFFLSANFLMINIDTLCIAFFKGSEAAGLYQIAAPIAQVVVYIALAIEAALYPFVSELAAKKEYPLVSKSRGLLLKLSFMLTIPFCLIFLSFPEIVINILFGSKFLGAVTSLRILSIGFLFFNLGLIAVSVLNGLGKPMINAKIVILAAIFNLVANIIMIPLYGIEGAAVATTMAYFIYFVLTNYFLNQEFRKNKITFSVPYGSMIKTLIGGMATLLVLFLLKSTIQLDLWGKLFAVLIPSFLFYTAWILFTKCIDSEDVIILKTTNLPIPKKLVDIIDKIVR